MSKRKLEDVPDIGDVPNQLKQFRFPDRDFGTSKVTKRRFVKDWFDKYPWLHYDEGNDRAFCHTCVTAFQKRHFSTADYNLKIAFISTGYTNWKEIGKMHFARIEVLLPMKALIHTSMQLSLIHI